MNMDKTLLLSWKYFLCLSLIHAIKRPVPTSCEGCHKRILLSSCEILQRAFSFGVLTWTKERSKVFLERLPSLHSLLPAHHTSRRSN